MNRFKETVKHIRLTGQKISQIDKTTFLITKRNGMVIKVSDVEMDDTEGALTNKYSLKNLNNGVISKEEAEASIF